MPVARFQALELATSICAYRRFSTKTEILTQNPALYPSLSTIERHPIVRPLVLGLFPLWS